MFHVLSPCSFRLTAHALLGDIRRPTRRAADHALRGGAALLALAAAASLVVRPALAPKAPTAAFEAATLAALPGGDLAGLRDAAEAGRAALLAVPGVGAVRIDGLQTGGVDLYASPATLRRLGITQADIAAAVPSHAEGAGRFSVANEVAQQGVQAIANLGVHAGQKVFRLGDVAAVARTSLAAPISVAASDGRPAVHLTVIPARPATPGLAERTAAALQAATLPPHVALALEP